MTEKTNDFSKDWESLSRITKEICQTISSIPMGFKHFQAMFEEDADIAISELRERGLVEERTLKEELEEKAKGISTERQKQMIQPQQMVPELSKTEHEALRAKRALDEYGKSQLEEKRLKLKPEFGAFIDTL